MNGAYSNTDIIHLKILKVGGCGYLREFLIVKLNWKISITDPNWSSDYPG